MTNIIENWWRHNGCYDREQASGILYIRNGKKEPIGKYLKETDEWWSGLSDKAKEQIYIDFCSEN